MCFYNHAIQQWLQGYTLGISNHVIQAAAAQQLAHQQVVFNAKNLTTNEKGEIVMKKEGKDNGMWLTDVMEMYVNGECDGLIFKDPDVIKGIRSAANCVPALTAHCWHPLKLNKKNGMEATMKKEGLTYLEAAQAFRDGKCKRIALSDWGIKVWVFFKHGYRAYVHISNEVEEPYNNISEQLRTDWLLVDPTPTPEEVIAKASFCGIPKGMTRPEVISQALRDKGMLKEGL